MSIRRENSIRVLLAELTKDFVDWQQYFDDLEPQWHYDKALQGKVIALRSLLKQLERNDLCESLEEFIPINGNALEALTYISDYIRPEVFDQLDRDLKKNEKNPIKPSLISDKIMENSWEMISKDYGVSKRQFGKCINFISDKYKRSIIFRDVEQAYHLTQIKYWKPAVILSGSTIEELLRLYLQDQKIKPKRQTFDSYIRACEDSNSLGAAVRTLTDSVRHFRNLVHTHKEVDRSASVTPAIAKGAVASIFTVANAVQA